MPEIAVVDVDLMKMGGAELVSMHILDSLQYEHEITLLTLTHPNFNELNDYYDTNVENIEVNVLSDDYPLAFFAAFSHRLGLGNLRRAFFNRLINHNEGEYDLIISADSEYFIQEDGILYIHMPNFYRGHLQKYIQPDGYIHRIYDFVSRRIARVSPRNISSNTTIANSGWTANIVESIYGSQPRVIYPPVNTQPFHPVSWEEKENGFVCIGKVVPAKNVIRNINIVSALRDQGHDVHLHIVGPIGDEKYGEQIKAAATSRDYIEFEGVLPREMLIRLIDQHRYGIHGKEYEHFGLVVAEFIAGGAIPFVPNSGGQVEIVNNQSELLYDTEDEAVRKIEAVLSDEITQSTVRNELPDIQEKFGVDRFSESILDIVQRRLPYDDD